MLQAGEIAEAVRSYEQAVRLAGKSAPGVYKLMGQLARRSAAGTGVAVDQLESSLPAVDGLPAHRIDELEDAAAGDPPSSPVAPKTMLLRGSVKSNLFHDGDLLHNCTIHVDLLSSASSDQAQGMYPSSVYLGGRVACTCA